MQIWAFLHWKNGVVVVFRRDLVWNPLPIIVLASGLGPWPQRHAVSPEGGLCCQASTWALFSALPS